MESDGGESNDLMWSRPSDMRSRGRRRIEIQIGSITQVALLDSGASINCIGNGLHNYFVNLGYVLKPTNIFGRVADGSKATSLGIL